MKESTEFPLLRHVNEGGVSGGYGLRSDLLVSVITPTFNHEKYIGACIESVLAQTYPHWEMWIIDDGSTDGTERVINSYSDHRIHYIKQKNKGIWRLSETYNKGLERSSGELIAILEGDDFWPPYKLEVQVRSFGNGAVLSWGRGGMTNSGGRLIGVTNQDIENYNKMDEKGQLKELILCDYILPCTVMCRKDSLLAIGGFKQVLYTPYVDYPTWLNLCLAGRFYACDTILGYWRRHGNQATTVLNKNMIESSRYQMEFYEALPGHLKKSMDLKAEDILETQNRELSRFNFDEGRKELYYRNFGSARNLFRQSLAGRAPGTKIKSIAGLACCGLRIDLEWLAKLLRKPTLSDILSEIN